MMEIDKEGTVRFKKNRIVSDVYEYHLDLNEIERRYQRGEYTFEEKYQFLALLGYSLDGLLTLLSQDFRVNKDQD